MNYRKKRIRRFFLIIGILFSLWFFCVKKPSFLFSKSLTYKNFKIYWNNPKLDTTKLKLILDRVELKTEESVYYSSIKINLFVCNNKVLYPFFSPSNARGLATNYVRDNNIFIADVDLKNELSKSLFRDYKEDLDKLLAHEITHGFLYENGFENNDRWIKEGYCEYIAYDRKDNLQNDYKMYLSSKDIYIKYRMCVTYLMAEKKMSLVDIVKSELTMDNVFKELKEKFIFIEKSGVN